MARAALGEDANGQEKGTPWCSRGEENAGER